MARGKKRTVNKKSETKKVEEKAEKKAEKKAEESQTVRLEGRRRKLQTFNLPHDVYCRKLGRCLCKEADRVTSFKSSVDKQRHLKKEKVKVCATFSVRWKHIVEVDRAALLCPEVKSALDKKWIREVK